MNIIILLTLFFALEGLLIGSFLNVVIDRLPLSKSLGGRSSCDNCGRTLSLWELIPVISYALQGGRSQCCHKRLKLQYSLVEAVTGLSFFMVSFAYLSRSPVLDIQHFASLMGLLIITASSIAITLIDWRHHIIPDELQLALFLGVIVYQFFTGNLQVLLVGNALIVALPILLLYLLTRGKGMGFGDVKMQMTLGLWLGLVPGFLGLYIGFLAGALYGVILLLLRKAGRKSQIAFGPFLLLGAWVTFWWNQELLRLLMRVFRW